MARIKTGKFVGCKICDKPIYRTPSFMKKYKNYFCSRKCHGVRMLNQKYSKGHKVTDELRAIIKKWNTGKKLSEETKKKISESHRGEKNYNWKGGNNKRYKHTTNTAQYKQWRSDVFTRDNWTCQTCNERGISLEAHHVKSWAEYPEFRFDVNNGVALCKDCHLLTRKKK